MKVLKYLKKKIILIKIDSTVEGNLARGKVGKKQLDNIDEELASIKNLKDYTMVAMLHHHLFPITRDEFLKQRWREKMFVGKIMDSSKALVDSQDLIEWFRKHQIQYVLHGHKHLPFLLIMMVCMLLLLVLLAEVALKKVIVVI